MRNTLALIIAAAVIGVAMLAAAGPARLAYAANSIADMLRGRPESRAVSVPRNRSGDFQIRTRANGVATPMVIDTGATSVILSYEAAKSIGLPLEVLKFSVEIETANGRARVAPVTLDRLAVGKLTERSVPALVAPPGQLKKSLLGMSFLDRLESWEVRADRLMLRGYP